MGGVVVSLSLSLSLSLYLSLSLSCTSGTERGFDVRGSERASGLLAGGRGAAGMPRAALGGRESGGPAGDGADGRDDDDVVGLPLPDPSDPILLLVSSVVRYSR